MKPTIFCIAISLLTLLACTSETTNSKTEATGPETMGPETTSWTVVATSPGDQKLQAIKAIRQHLNLGLREAKDLVDDLPATIATNASEADANTIADKLRAAGMTVEIKPD